VDNFDRPVVATESLASASVREVGSTSREVDMPWAANPGVRRVTVFSAKLKAFHGRAVLDAT